ncbi:MAG: hypothetical protein ACTSYZ_08530 [Candidatus Helarchaeota archaeon]
MDKSNYSRKRSENCDTYELSEVYKRLVGFLIEELERFLSN